MAEITDIIRAQRTDGTWLQLSCEIRIHESYPEIYVPEWNQVWAISETGMIGNIGGNDWRIYTLHPDDCAKIVERWKNERADKSTAKSPA
jgi:hypothetical protein